MGYLESAFFHAPHRVVEADIVVSWNNYYPLAVTLHERLGKFDKEVFSLFVLLNQFTVRVFAIFRDSVNHVSTDNDEVRLTDGGCFIPITVAVAFKGIEQRVVRNGIGRISVE